MNELRDIETQHLGHAGLLQALVHRALAQIRPELTMRFDGGLAAQTIAAGMAKFGRKADEFGIVQLARATRDDN
jgi:hypothetical protein